MGELTRKVISEARASLCEECPVTCSSDDTLRLVEFEQDGSTKKVAFETMVATKLASTAMLRDEVGCRGTFLCGSCEDLHCGAERDVVIDISAHGSNEPLDYQN
jgi:hypothetical protein